MHGTRTAFAKSKWNNERFTSCSSFVNIRAGLRLQVALSPRLIEGPPTLKNTCLFMGAQNFFSRGEQNHQHHKNITIFCRAAGANENFWAFSRRFRPLLKVGIASAEGASEILGCFVANKHMTILSNFRGWDKGPFPPVGAHVSGILDDVFRSQQLLQSANYWCFWLPESKYGNERYRFSTSREGHLLLVATPPGAYGVISSTVNMGR